MIDVGSMATTIQQRLREVCDLRGVSSEQLSLAAGLSRSYISRIINDQKRTGLNADEFYRIAFEARVSPSYLLYGIGSILGPDVLKEPPPPRPGQSRRYENHPNWVEVALAAIEKEPTLDWAIIGVGETPLDPREELSLYFLLAAAERFKRASTSNDERTRLDERARAFRKLRRPSKAAEMPPKKRGSQPPVS